MNATATTTAKIFLTDYASYNNGTQFEFGHWVELNDFNDEEKDFWLEMEGIKKEILELEEYSEKEYYRNKYLAKIFRKERNFTAALKYYAAAHIHKNYMQLIFKDNNQ